MLQNIPLDFHRLLVYDAVFQRPGSLGVVTAETGGVAYWAYIGGFVGGLGLAWFYQRFLGRSDQPWRTQINVRRYPNGIKERQ